MSFSKRRLLLFEGDSRRATGGEWLRSEEMLANLVRQAASEYGTPAWVYLPDEAFSALELLRAGLTAWGDAAVAYSVKTNPLGRLLRDLRARGCLAEVVSRHERELAERSGFLPEEIVVNGPLKEQEDFDVAASRPPRVFNIDALWELDALAAAAQRAESIVPVGLRLASIRPDGRLSRFGLTEGELRQGVDEVRNLPGLALSALHLHAGTQLDENNLSEAVARGRAIYDDLALGDDVALDIGGGFPFQHEIPLEAQPFDPTRFFDELALAWGGRRPPLIVEPGRWVAAPAFALAMRVVSVKERGSESPIVVTDSGIHHNIQALFHPQRWDAEGDGQPVRQRLVGALCMEEDEWGVVDLPRLRRGDLLIQWNAGAYSLSLARTFIQPRPPIVRASLADGLHLLEPREEFAMGHGIRT